VVAVCTFLVSAFFLGKYFLGLKENKENYEDMSNELIVTDTQGEEIWVWDFQKMLESYPDVKGWIRQGEYIDYPVVQTSDNSYYLKHNTGGEYNEGGAIFIDYRNDQGLEDRNCIIVS
jgi:sortase B